MDKEKAPTPLRFDMEKKEKRVGGKRASLALLLSLLAVSGTSYVCYNQYLQSADLAQGNEDAFKLIGSLSDDLNTNTLDLATLKSKTVIFEEALQGFTLLEKELADQRKKIANLDSVTRSQNQEIAEALASLQQSQDHLEALKSNFQGLSQSQKEIVKIAERKIAQARVAPAPEHTEPSRPIISSTLGTAAIESMDSWGNTQYVVIRDSSGEWISVRKGNTYDGWLFTGATNEYAVFTRGDRTMKVKIGG
jgi:septal ring factor EnvC (AmiA/AmiB activator)